MTLINDYGKNIEITIISLNKKTNTDRNRGGKSVI